MLLRHFNNYVILADRDFKKADLCQAQTYKEAAVNYVFIGSCIPTVSGACSALLCLDVVGNILQMNVMGRKYWLVYREGLCHL